MSVQNNCFGGDLTGIVLVDQSSDMGSTPDLTSESATQTSSSPSSTSSLSPPRTPPNLHQNSIDPESKWLVQKYGGTSVGKFAKKIAKDIVS